MGAPAGGAAGAGAVDAAVGDDRAVAGQAELADGVLRLTLRTKSYEWEFVPEAGKDFKDSGRSLVH